MQTVLPTRSWAILLLFVALAWSAAMAGPTGDASAHAGGVDRVAAASASGAPALPAPRLDGSTTVERALQQRRSLRDFDARGLTLAQVGQLLWAAQGLSGEGGRRTAPSAGASYPLTLWLVAGRVEGLTPGVFGYDPAAHALRAGPAADLRAGVAAAAQQRWIGDAPAIVVVAGETSRSAPRYGVRAERYTLLEAGAAAQNLTLQAVALGLGTTWVGAFDDAALQRLLALPAGQAPLLLLPVGHRQ